MRRLPLGRGAILLYVMTAIANVLAFGYQFVMPRLLRPAEFAVLTQLFGILLVEAIGTQVIQSSTAKLTAQYRARGDEHALRAFVVRWLRRIVIGAAIPATVIVVASPLISGQLSLSTFSIVLLGLTLFLSVITTFGLGVLQGLGRFVWLGSNLIAQSGTRLGFGALLVAIGLGVDGAFFGATLALAVGGALGLFPLRGFFRRESTAGVPDVRAGEVRFFALAGIVILAYAGLTNIDAVLARALLPESEVGAYAGAITLGKVILFAPVAVAFILLERTARAHERGQDTERALFLALGFVLATSGAVAAGYVIAPAFLTNIVVGSQYGATAALVPTYGIAALSNALLSLWNAYFIGRGELRIGFLLAAALLVEVLLLAFMAHDALTMARIVAGVAISTQLIAAGTFVWVRMAAVRAHRV